MDTEQTTTPAGVPGQVAPLKRGASAWLLRIMLTVGVLWLFSLVVSSFLEAQDRAVKNDMRSIATAMEVYRQDHGSYPMPSPMEALIYPPPSSPALAYHRVEPGSASLAGVTTPVSYMSSLFTDPFSKDALFPYVYWRTDDRWLMASPGFDLDYDLPADFTLVGDRGLLLGRLLDYTYDPTNGYRSNGDVWRLSEDPNPKPTSPAW